MKTKALLVLLVVGQFAFNCWVAWRLRPIDYGNDTVVGPENWSVRVAGGAAIRSEARSGRVEIFNTATGAWQPVGLPAARSGSFAR